MVTFTPTWNKILNGDSVTMSCDVDSTVQGDVTYDWYRKNQWTHSGKTFTIQSAQSRHGGNYQCRTSEQNVSEDVTLNVTKGPVVLQSPPFIYEGDDLSLRCHSGSQATRGPILFFKNNQDLGDVSYASPEILVGNHRDGTAVYKCTKQVITSGPTRSEEIEFSVQGAAVRMVVTFSPNWKTIFTGESITMTCDGNHYGPYYWYKDRTLMKRTEENSIKINSAQRNDSGKYECATQSEYSPTVSLEVSDAQVILQAPIQVSGRILYLKYHSRLGYNVEWIKFYKDGKLLQNSEDEKLLLKQGEADGRYSCEKQHYISCTDSVSVPIRELFSRPEIKLTPSAVTEGNGMTLTCDTRLSPHRQTTQLQFAFYREGQEVQGFNLSNKYQVSFIKLEDSGNFSCKSGTMDNRVWKKSPDLHVQIHETDGHYRYLYHMVSGTLLVIVIVSALLICRQRHQFTRLLPKRNQTRDSEPASTIDFPEADDVCYTSVRLPAKVSASSHEVTETVVYSPVKMRVTAT